MDRHLNPFHRPLTASPCRSPRSRPGRCSRRSAPAPPARGACRRRPRRSVSFVVIGGGRSVGACTYVGERGGLRVRGGGVMDGSIDGLHVYTQIHNPLRCPPTHSLSITHPLPHLPRRDVEEAAAQQRVLVVRFPHLGREGLEGAFGCCFVVVVVVFFWVRRDGGVGYCQILERLPRFGLQFWLGCLPLF